MIDKIKGGLFGVAVGDALGIPCEFFTPGQIEQLYGRVTEITGGGLFGFEKGEVSDDTDMTLCVAKGLLASPLDPYGAIGEAFLAWRDTKPKDMGNITESVFSMYNGDWFYAAEQAHQSMFGRSAGNGSLMRVLPVALFYQQVNEAVQVAHTQSKMTHYDDLASEACILYTKIAHRLLRGATLLHAIDSEVTGTRYESVLHEEPNVNPDGFVCNTLQWVLYTLLNTTTFEEVVVTLANLGHDADTTAAIAGGLAGIYYGYDAIPMRYIETLCIQEELHAIATELYAKRK